MKIRALLIDDEHNSRAILRNYLTKYCPDVAIVGEASSIQEALIFLKSHAVDLLFLDVEMPHGNAFDLLEQLPDRDFETVFVTAYDQYAMEALNNHATYYLLKPLSIDELIKAVQVIKEIKTKEAQLQDQILKTSPLLSTNKITLPVQDGFDILEVAEIMYCRADDNYTQLHLTTGKKLLISKTLKYFETHLSPYGFARIHKSFVVNVNQIMSYKKGKGGSVILKNGVEISVSASQKSRLLSYFK